MCSSGDSSAPNEDISLSLGGWARALQAFPAEATNMAEVLVRFTELVQDDSGIPYQAQASGAFGSDGLWEGWIEFIGENGRALRTPRETTQARCIAHSMCFSSRLHVLRFPKRASSAVLRPPTPHEYLRSPRDPCSTPGLPMRRARAFFASNSPRYRGITCWR